MDLDVVEARGLAAAPTGRRPRGGSHLARHPARGTDGPGRPPRGHRRAPERGRSLERAPAMGLLAHRRDHPGIGRDRETARSVANSIGLVAAGRSAGQSHSRGHAVPGVRRSPAGELVAVNPTMRQTTRGALGEGGDVAAPLGGEAGDQGGVEVGAVLRCVLGLSGAGDEHRGHGSSIPRRLAGDDQPGDARTLGERERPVRDLVDHPPPTREPCRRTWAGEHGPENMGRRTWAGEHGPENMGRRTWAGEHGPENMGRRTWPWRARSTRDRRGRRPASATRGRCRGSRASAG